MGDICKWGWMYTEIVIKTWTPPYCACGKNNNNGILDDDIVDNKKFISDKKIFVLAISADPTKLNNDSDDASEYCTCVCTKSDIAICR